MKKVKESEGNMMFDKHMKCVSDFLNDNKKDIEESVVSLRFMKQIESFLEENKCTKRDLARELSYSESYISQLMTGSKKINISFINKFEKHYDVKFKLGIKNCKEMLNIETIDYKDVITYVYEEHQIVTFVSNQNLTSNVFRSGDVYRFNNLKKIGNEE
ncbi:helix-turn-helix transcriptional regulator [Myroides odoratimimus]|uniref:helix-turn-helix domain-containing protein n=1 Tax=Myroides odoratimimus TaxID=76832 RepID=UPI0025778826|nr:helix-turn-helix transcriptional regulator [Myroides odoratimimus]MDM1397104.1 helix-turn-helix transcriptional regulator [Myroides odoratimimus]